MGAPTWGVSRGPSAACALLAVVALAGSGCGGDKGGQQLKKPAQEAAGVVQSFERDLVARDYRHICNEIFSVQVRRQAGGGACAAFLRRTAGAVQQPKIEVKGIALAGQTAKVHVETSARGQARVAETIQLVRQRGHFRIASLSR